MNRKSDLVAELVLALREQASRTLMFHQAIAERAGLGPTDMKALDLARSEESLTAGGLARVTGLSTSATTAQLDRLEQRGFIERRRDPRDRRKVIIVPAGDGGSGVADVFAGLEKLLREYLGDYTAEEIAVVLRFVTDMNAQSALRTAEFTAAGSSNRNEQAKKTAGPDS